jgi:hypothetical protein
MSTRLVICAAMTAFTAACPADAMADAPSADACATASDNAQPLRKAGRLRETRQQLLVCVNKSCPTIVRDDCAAQLSEVAKAIPTIVFDAKDASGADLSSVVVLMDGAPLVDHLDGRAIAVDPGAHQFFFRVPGASSVSKGLVLQEGEKDRHERIVFAASSVAKDAPDVPAASPGQTRSSWPTYVTFGIGAAGLALGVTYTIISISQKSTLDSEQAAAASCATTSCKNSPNAATIQAADDDASSKYNADFALTMVGYGVGLVGVGVGTYLLLTAGSTPSREEKSKSVSVTPWIGLRAAGLVGRF